MTNNVDVLDEFTSVEENDHVVYSFRNKSFKLNKRLARERMAGKRVINGIKTAELNVLPLKYPEVYWRTLEKILAYSEPPGYRQSQPRKQPMIGPHIKLSICGQNQPLERVWLGPRELVHKL